MDLVEGMGRFRKRWTAVLAASGLAWAAGGCSFFAPTMENVRIETDSREAVVIVNGTQYSGTPLVLPLSCKHDVLIEAYIPDRDGMPRGLRRNYVVRRTLSACGVLDTLGTIAILPGFGLLTGGAYDLREHDVRIDLKADRTNVPYVPEEEL